MKSCILALFSVLSLAAVTAAIAWHDPEYFKAFEGRSGLTGEYRPIPDRSGFGYGYRIHIERGTYDGGYLLRVYTRGIRPQDIAVSAGRGRLWLQSQAGTRRDWQDEHRRSRVSVSSSLRRSIPLPYDADLGKLEITVSDDLLEIRIPGRLFSER